MKKNQSYTAEFKAEAVKLVREQQLSHQEAAQRVGIPKGSLSNWVASSQRRGQPAAPGAGASGDGARNRKKSGRVLCEGIAARYAVMKELQVRHDYPVAVLCSALGVSRSGYYAWCERPASARQRDDERLKVAIRGVHAASRQTYGTRRVLAELLAQGFEAGRDRVDRLRRTMALRCRQKRCFRVTTDSGHTLPVADNLLQQHFAASAPDQVWLTDIT
jgi:putative transposase